MATALLASTIACSSRAEHSEPSVADGSSRDLPVLGVSFRSTFEQATATIQRVDDETNAKANQCLTDKGYPEATTPGTSGEPIATDNLFRPTTRSIPLGRPPHPLTSRPPRTRTRRRCSAH